MPANPGCRGFLHPSVPDGGWLIYALGGGWGHLHRAIAIARSLVSAGPVQILTNSPYAAQVEAERAATPGLQLHRIPADWGIAETQQQVQQWLQTLPYGGLMVDTFPRGLLGELADLVPSLTDRERVLIHRDLNPDYVAKADLTPFVQQHYTQVWVPGEGPTVAFAALPQTRHIPPWLIRTPAELPAWQTACQILRLTPSEQRRPLILVLVSGQPEERAFFAAVAAAIAQTVPPLTVRIIAADPPAATEGVPWISHYPAMELLAWADAVIGGGGYNTVYECLALEVPLIGIPWKRLYDRQALRLHRAQTLAPRRVYSAQTLPEILHCLREIEFYRKNHFRLDLPE